MSDAGVMEDVAEDTLAETAVEDCPSAGVGRGGAGIDGTAGVIDAAALDASGDTCGSIETMPVAAGSAVDASRLTDAERALMTRADQWLAAHADEFERTLARWVAVPSICDDGYAGGEAADDGGAANDGRPTPLGPAVADMFDVASEDMRAMGLAPCNHGGYALSAAVESGDSRFDLEVGGEDEIALVGHLDVVPAGDGWTRPPFALTREGEFVFGRGVHDCKGPSLVNLFVLRMIRDLDVPMRHRVRALMGGGEETRMNDLRGYLAREQAAGFSLVTDGPFPVNYGQKGILQITMSVPAPGIWRHFAAGSAANAVPGEASIELSGISGVAVESAIAESSERYRETVRWDAAARTLHAQGIAGHAAFQDGTVSAIMLLTGFLAESGLLDGPDHVAELATARALFAIAQSKDGRGLGIACEDESGPLSFNLGRVMPDAEGVSETDGNADPLNSAEFGAPNGSVGAEASGDNASAETPGERLRLQCDSRYPVSGNGPDIERTLRATVAAMPADWDVRVESVHDEPAYRIDPDGVECRTLTRAFNDFFDADKQPFTMGGGTHSRLLPRSVTFGADFWYMEDIARKAGHPAKPASMGEDEGGAHSADECVNTANLLTAAKLYLLALTRLDGMLE
ncbi:M20/M25/M40 family metallo-hydrolase [Bifidobacterium miconisargentati]|uniref:M20/M25/M40 family metallo-hydrolase n=1 Tax=Bifidobacterium miconisargentati TaxID=2834437 RepID=UPI001BDD15CD|nr:M20/M25/M40 family metallo-hydrolase [Bifidobacterium miconisargentati]MBW3090483.1 M20/M25/M40 family metallo-hydrolase [Bifidobacterium miconisargentati]